MQLRHPAPVGVGGHVRVISPSWPSLFHAPPRARRAEKVLQEFGLRVSYGTYASEISDDGVSAGSAEQRAADFMEAFADPSVDVVFSTYGGESAHELIPLLDAELLRTQRKAFVGNSDNVWLHQFLLQEAGLSSYYGITYVGELGEFNGPFPEIVDQLRRALMSTEDLVYTPMLRRSNDTNRLVRPESEHKSRQFNMEGGWQWLRPGYGRGQLIGGEIRALVELVAHFDMRLDDCVVFWDLTGRTAEGLHENLTALADRVSLKGLAGMVVGPHSRIPPDDWARLLDEALSAVVPTAPYPILVNADVGHLDPRWVVPYGREAVLDSSRGLVLPR
jgi:muramoyltetrapeptide carboxypeptidase LdcA involved in peptidoglycan recycling